MAQGNGNRNGKGGESPPTEDGAKPHYRTVFVSDVHMGSSVSQCGRLVEFLKSVSVDRLCLVGDIVDMYALKRRFQWSQEYNSLIRRVFKMAKKGVKVVYVPGNHDGDLRGLANMDFAGIKIMKRYIHQTADGKRLLVIHGDEFDGVLRERLMFLYECGDFSYEMAVRVGWLITPVLSRFFGVQWSLSKYLKSKVKNVVKFINSYERLVMTEGRHQKVDGVVTGHIHTAELKTINGLLYANCGCWTESCEAIVEHGDGRLELLRL